MVNNGIFSNSTLCQTPERIRKFMQINITERKKAEEAITRQAELIDLSPDAIIVESLMALLLFGVMGQRNCTVGQKKKLSEKISTRC